MPMMNRLILLLFCIYEGASQVSLSVDNEEFTIYTDEKTSFYNVHIRCQERGHGTVAAFDTEVKWLDFATAVGHKTKDRFWSGLFSMRVDGAYQAGFSATMEEYTGNYLPLDQFSGYRCAEFVPNRGEIKYTHCSYTKFYVCQESAGTTKCEVSPCQNGGTCGSETFRDFKCDCNKGWSGTICNKSTETTLPSRTESKATTDLPYPTTTAEATTSLKSKQISFGTRTSNPASTKTASIITTTAGFKTKSAEMTPMATRLFRATRSVSSAAPKPTSAATTHVQTSEIISTETVDETTQLNRITAIITKDHQSRAGTTTISDQANTSTVASAADTTQSMMQTKLMTTVEERTLHLTTKSLIYPFDDPYAVSLPQGIPPICSPPPVVASSVSIETGRYVGDTITYRCQEGYKMVGGGKWRVITCVNSLRWSLSNGIKCTAISCLNERGLKHLMAGKIERSECKEAEKYPNGLSKYRRKCVSIKENPKWTSLTPLCDVGRCGALPLVNNAGPGDYTTDRNITFWITCLKGHSYPDGSTSKTIQCIDGSWTDIDHCFANNCPTLLNIENAVVDSAETTYTSVVTISCLLGFEMDNGRNHLTVECLANKTWNLLIRNCSAISCLNSPNVTFGERSDRSDSEMAFYPFDYRITYVCDGDNRFPDGTQTTTLSCVGTNKWSWDDIDCSATRCPPVPGLVNGKPSSTRTDEGSVVVYSCTTGYNMTQTGGTNHITCTDRTWTPSTENCLLNQCENLDIPGQKLNTSETAWKTHVQIMCDEGHEISDDNGEKKNQAVHHCEAEGLWDPSVYQCQPVDCGQPPPVFNSIQEGLRHTTYGSNVTYTCEVGYWVHRNIHTNTATCDKNKAWKPSDISCTAITCLPLQTWNGLNVSSYDRHYLAEVNTSCADGYYFSDSSTHKEIICDGSGHWSPHVPVCKASKPAADSPPQEAPSSNMIGTAVVGVFSGVGVIMLILDIPIAILHGTQAIQSIRNFFGK